MIQIPDFAKKDDLFTWLRANKSMLNAAKKSQPKRADSVMLFPALGSEATIANKQAAPRPELLEEPKFLVKVVINTTNIFDSHYDVHIPGLWKKSLKEKKDNYLIQEHELCFEKIISDEVKATAQTFSFAELGYQFDGVTEALLFEAMIDPERNEFMAEQYAKGRVKNHSVGMQYVNLIFCLNSESKYDSEEKANWDKYYYQIANKEAVDEVGFFWAVLEAKIIEGSAVVIGSNQYTPTIQIGKEISLGSSRATTDEEPKQVDYNKLINLKFYTK